MGMLDLFNGSKSVDIDMGVANSISTSPAFTGYGTASESNAMKVSALNCGVSLISDAIAGLPVFKYKINSDGSKTKVEEKVNYLLNNNANDYTTAFNAKQIMLKNSILNGNGFLWIKRGSGFEIESLIPLTASECKLETKDNGETWKYAITKYGKNVSAEYHEVINLASKSEDGINGQGILKYGASVLGLEASQNLHLGSLFENGISTKSVLYVSKDTTKEQRDSLGIRLKNFFTKGNSGKVMVLPEDAKLESVNISPVDLQTLQSKEFNIVEIANLLKISPYLIGGKISSGLYGSLEESNIAFLQNTLTPYIIQLEQVFAHYLLTEEEKASGEYCFRFDTSKLLRTNSANQMAMLDTSISNGIMSVKEVRDILDLPAIEGTDMLLFSKFGSSLANGQLTNLQSMTVLNESGPADGAIT